MNRINGVLKYTSQHDGGFGLGISVVWNVPWTARIEWRETDPCVEDIEHNGRQSVELVRVTFPGLVYSLNENTAINEALKKTWAKICLKDYMLNDIDQQILSQIKWMNEQRGDSE